VIVAGAQANNGKVWGEFYAASTCRRSGPHAAEEASTHAADLQDLPRALWRESERAGAFAGAPVDRADGFIHLSTASQVQETAARHFAGQDDLLLVAVEADRLGEALRWEPSRGGALFPHLYAALPLPAVAWVEPLALGSDGAHLFPDLEERG
jgi:uncharacterized protein (DUF952 family)